MSEENQMAHQDAASSENASEQYSVAMVDTIFADTLSRGMQNAITSQQNAQMASASSVTNACARILQAKAKPIEGPIQAQGAEHLSGQNSRHDGSDKAKEAKAPFQSGVRQSGAQSSEEQQQPQSDLQESGVAATEKIINEEGQATEALAADRLDASNKQSGLISSRKLFLMLVASASLSAVIAGAFVSTYFTQ